MVSELALEYVLFLRLSWRSLHFFIISANPRGALTGLSRSAGLAGVFLVIVYSFTSSEDSGNPGDSEL
jgi:hypothetical protein